MIMRISSLNEDVRAWDIEAAGGRAIGEASVLQIMSAITEIDSKQALWRKRVHYNAFMIISNYFRYGLAHRNAYYQRNSMNDKWYHIAKKRRIGMQSIISAIMKNMS